MKQTIYEAHRTRIAYATQEELVALAMQLVEKLKSMHSHYLDNNEAKRELGDRIKHLHRRNIALERTVEQLQDDLTRAKQTLMRRRNAQE